MLGKKRKASWDNSLGGNPHRKSRASVNRPGGKSGECITWVPSDWLCTTCGERVHETKDGAEKRCFSCS